MKSITIDSKLENKGHYVPGVISKGMLQCCLSIWIIVLMFAVQSENC